MKKKSTAEKKKIELGEANKVLLMVAVVSVLTLVVFAGIGTIYSH